MSSSLVFSFLLGCLLLSLSWPFVRLGVLWGFVFDGHVLFCNGIYPLDFIVPIITLTLTLTLTLTVTCRLATFVGR